MAAKKTPNQGGTTTTTTTVPENRESNSRRSNRSRQTEGGSRNRTTTTTVPRNTTTTTAAPRQDPPGTPGDITSRQADWVIARSATYVAIGLSRAAADRKALSEVGTQFSSQDPYDVIPPGNLEAPGAAKKQLAAMKKAKLDPATNRWLVKGYGDTLVALETTVKAQVSSSPTGPTGPAPTGPAVPRTPTAPRNPTTPRQPGQVVDVGGEKVRVGGQRWKQIIQEEFGSLWDVYNNNPDVAKVIDDSVKQGYFNDETKMTSKLQNTCWYRTTANSTRQFAIKMSSDPATLEAEITQEVEGIRQKTLTTGITFDDATLRKLATDKIKFGWSAEQESNAIGSEAVALAQLGGTQGISDLRTGVVARGLREKAAAYAQKPSEALIDSWTQEIMLGKKTSVNWEDLMRDSARTQFRSLQPALDKGQDVETALYAYKQQAVSTLGSSIDATNIDWTSEKWNKALNFRDERTNEYRQMDLWEWNRYLRTLPEWQNTDEAKDTYRNVALSLAQGFGRMA